MEASNQPPPLADVNLLASDPVLTALVETLPNPVFDDLSAHADFWGSQEAAELARFANAHPPGLRSHDPGGDRIDRVEYHPAYHALMRRSVGAALHCSMWDAGGEEGPVRTLARAARLFVTAEVECGHLSAIITTSGAVTALSYSPALSQEWIPLVRSRRYDSTTRTAEEKGSALIAYAGTERQAGSEPRMLTTRGERAGDGLYRLTGAKSFVAAPASDAFLVLAHLHEGPTCFLAPRLLPDGTRNRIDIVRMRETLGLRSSGAADLQLDRATAWLVGEPGRGLAAIAETVALARLDDAVASAALMRMALAEAVHHARHRRVGTLLLRNQPLMTRVLADMALDVLAAMALAFRVAEAVDRAADDPAEAAFARLMTPVAKYWITKAAPPLIAEALECLGAGGYAEDGRLARLHRDAPALALRDGPGSVVALEAVQLLRRAPEMLEDVLGTCNDTLGAGARPTLNVLRAAAAVALSDEGSARFLVEQLAVTAAAAAIGRLFPNAVADAFVDTRLGKEWRTTYGMLDSRFDSGAFIDFVCPG
ncbi:MAG: acyl-CoA dehydrogenase family protein [Bauldia sp.]|nr:acyl-CoA dehydrogenase family protein [Bauldia sp.]